jgi:hypothetical protein
MGTMGISRVMDQKGPKHIGDDDDDDYNNNISKTDQERTIGGCRAENLFPQIENTDFVDKMM